MKASLNSREKLLLLDGNALLHRAFHAVPPTLRTSRGEPTNAVFGFLSSLLSAIEKIGPRYVVATFDPPGKTFRHRTYAAYKATRQKAPAELFDQLDRVKQFVEAMEIPIYEVSGYEADDVIGTIVEHLCSRPIEIVIASGDKDALQLLRPHVMVWTLKQGIKESVLYDQAMLKAERDVSPAGFRLAKALRGDPSDNIPGVVGIGEKTANIVGRQFETPEKLHAALVSETIEQLKERGLTLSVQEKLKEGEEVIQQAYELVTIRTDVPINFDLAATEFKPKLTEELLALFRVTEMTNLLRRFQTLTGESQASSEKRVPRHYEIVTRESWPTLSAKLATLQVVAFDTETDDLAPIKQRMVGCSLAWEEGRAFYLPFGHKEGVNLPRKILHELGQILRWKELLVVGHNLKFDLHTLANEDEEMLPRCFDTMVAAHLLQPDNGNQSLDQCSLAVSGEQLQPITSIIGTGRQQKNMRDCSIELVGPYAAEDADFTMRLYRHYAPLLKERGIDTVMEQIEMPLLLVLFEMERRGVQLDNKVLADQKQVLEHEVDKVRKRIVKLAGHDFNVNSADQLAVILFDELKLSSAGIRRSQKRPSTAALELEKLKDKHPIVADILEYREKTKLISTYVLALPQLVEPKDGRLHTTYSQTTASTGRLSSYRPNLQNIPIRTEDGRRIRRAFIAAPGKVLLSADYSQIELRIVAHFSKDPALMRVFREGRDLHTATAAEIFHQPPLEVTPEQRRIAKAINFSLMFGVSAFGLSEYIGTTTKQAAEFIERYFQVYHGVREYMDQAIRRAKKLGYTETLHGFRLPIPDLKSEQAVRRAAAERLALNAPIQGTEAEMLKKAMVLLGNMPGVTLILTVHDELVFELVEKEIPEAAQRVREVMENSTPLDVPVRAEFKVGKSWGEMTDYQVEKA